MIQVRVYNILHILISIMTQLFLEFGTSQFACYRIIDRTDTYHIHRVDIIMQPTFIVKLVAGYIYTTIALYYSYSLCYDPIAALVHRYLLTTLGFIGCSKQSKSCLQDCCEYHDLDLALLCTISASRRVTEWEICLRLMPYAIDTASSYI